MIEMLQFSYMRQALYVGILLSIMIPSLGVIMVHRKTSMIGDALSHSSLAGVALGLILNIDPVIGALCLCVFAGLSMNAIRKRFPQFGDMATAIVMSTGLALASVLSDFAKGGSSFDAYLFGSITVVSSLDTLLISICFVLVVFSCIYYYQALLSLAIDPILARINGVKEGQIDTLFTILSAATIAISCKVVGALMISSLIVLPTATALLFAKSYKQVYLTSVLLGSLYMLVGLLSSYFYGIKPGGSVVLIALAAFLVLGLFGKIKKWMQKK